ncbi:MAG TPA: hypothetical protein VHP38_12770 [Ruminiclostridium sp.]|nr:hypothetical protein [Ruminiclostridium sp.]
MGLVLMVIPYMMKAGMFFRLQTAAMQLPHILRIIKKIHPLQYTGKPETYS